MAWTLSLLVMRMTQPRLTQGKVMTLVWTLHKMPTTPKHSSRFSTFLLSLRDLLLRMRGRRKQTPCGLPRKSLRLTAPKKRLTATELSQTPLFRPTSIITIMASTTSNSNSPCTTIRCRCSSKCRSNKCPCRPCRPCHPLTTWDMLLNLMCRTMSITSSSNSSNSTTSTTSSSSSSNNNTTCTTPICKHRDRHLRLQQMPSVCI
mmetsp:Transcript_23921/g.38364  ORF Transcript_23921/g.38364 Transcript_23921/m.38364 type:complete len:204 (-) Transcript_23921:1075-1686(-)